MFPLLITEIIINYAAVCFISISAGLLTGILNQVLSKHQWQIAASLSL